MSLCSCVRLPSLDALLPMITLVLMYFCVCEGLLCTCVEEKEEVKANKCAEQQTRRSPKDEKMCRVVSRCLNQTHAGHRHYGPHRMSDQRTTHKLLFKEVQPKEEDE